ncbi:MAG TPA: DUF3305 domain-containing protein [Xanthobacteraceae bacterium]|nr:DUF3305 domain-containing protein [Xanthobacteraceae bacterium]
MSLIEPLARIPVGVVVERRKAKNQWSDFVWRPVAVLAGVPDTEPWTVLDRGVERTTFYAGAAEIALYRSDCSSYRANLGTSAPKLWVVLRETASDPPYKVAAVTADPSEGEAFTESGTDLVESVTMPEPICAMIAAFIAEQHVEDRVFAKRTRDRADPQALARRAPVKDRR